MLRMLLLPLALLCAPASLAGQAAADAPAPKSASWVTVPTPLDPRLVTPAPQPSEAAARTVSPRLVGEASLRQAMVRGAVIGATLGGAWGLYLDLSADRDESFRGGMTALGVLGGALNGALVGFAVQAIRER